MPRVIIRDPVSGELVRVIDDELQLEFIRNDGESELDFCKRIATEIKTKDTYVNQNIKTRISS